MAQPERNSRYHNIHAQPEDSSKHQDGDATPIRDDLGRSQRPVFRGSQASQDTIKATPTPPIEIPGTQDEDFLAPPSEQDHDSFMDQFMRNRKPSISFSNEITTEEGHRQSINEPLPKLEQSTSRGRSFAQSMSGEHAARAHSESDRSHYDLKTGRHLPKYSTSPPREHAHVGEARFPLLQTTVDAMARESHTHLPQNMSMTSESTMSPTLEEVQTPEDEKSDYLTSPIPITPSWPRFSSSYELSRSGQRKASQRWRDGEAAQDFFTRAGSMRKSMRDTARRPSRRDTAGSAAKSPNSAASSFLKGFSLGSGENENAGPPAVDAEGQTIGEDYVLGKQIGFGGFSTIKEVTQLSAETGKQRKLAVKVVRRHIEDKSEAENEAAQAEFEHEVELWRLLNNRHILPLEAVYKLDEATFCFIPLNVGGTLFDLIRSNRQGLPSELACNYSYQIAAALRYLHLDARVVHRDIKLENCLLDTSKGEPGLIRLCDFGMAEWISSDGDDSLYGSNESLANTVSSQEAAERRVSKIFGPANTSTSAFAGGSLEYAAPEILRIATDSSGNIHRDSDTDSLPGRAIISPSVDIWAMGVCVYTLLMGKRPFSDTFQPRIVMAILAGDWDRDALQDKAGAYPTEVVSSCLEMSARRRSSIVEIMDKRWFDVARIQFADDDDDDRSDEDGGDGSKGRWRL